MWTPNSSPIGIGGIKRVVADHVLYYYDGPCIFTARLGLIECLFYKVDEDEFSDLFLVTFSHEDTIAALKAGSLSMLGAIQFQSQHWLVALDGGMNVKSVWEVQIADLPDEYVPDSSVGVKPQVLPAADSPEQAFSFLSIKFTGQELSQQTIPLGTLKTIVDSVYDSFRRIFPPPAVDQKSLARHLDFNVFQPRFASLIIAMKEPVVDLSRLKREIRDKVDLQSVRQAFEKSRQEFFANLAHVVREASKGDIKQGFAVEHFATLYQVSDLVPTERSEIDTVEFRSGATAANAPVSIDDRIGLRIRNAYRVAEKSPRTAQGTVVEVNAASRTFVIRDGFHRQITCVLQAGIFEEFKPSVADQVRVRGVFTRRSRRDRIEVQGWPEKV